MPRRSRPLLLLVLPLLAACASGDPATRDGSPAPAVAAPALDPVGVYDFTLTMGSQSRTGVLTIHRQDGAYGGTGTLEGETHAAEVMGVEVEGERMLVRLAVPGGESGTFDLTRHEDRFTGTLFMGDQAIDAVARRRP